MKDILEYISNNYFPVNREKSLNLDLGDEWRNKSEERVNQALNRVMAIYDDLFKGDELIFLVKKSFSQDDPFFDEIEKQDIDEIVKIDENNKSRIRFSGYIDDEFYDYEYYLYTLNIGDLKVQVEKLMLAIINFDLGRSPSINEKIFMVDKKNKVVLHPYDDRGCMVFFNDLSLVNPLYIKYSDWIDEFEKEKFTKFCKKI